MQVDTHCDDQTALATPSVHPTLCLSRDSGKGDQRTLSNVEKEDLKELEGGGTDAEGEEEGEPVEKERDIVPTSSNCNGRERCYIHFGSKQVNRAIWQKNGRDKCACPECLEEKRRFLEDVKYAHLPEAERKLKTYVQMGAFFCTPCVRNLIAEGRPFVQLREDGSVQSLITCVK